MKVLDAKYGDGRKVVMEVNMHRACNACKMRGVEDTCEHRIQRPQHFQNAADVGFVEALLSPWAGSAERELHNVSDRPLITPAFPMGVDLLLNRARDVDVTRQDHRFVFVTIDPAAMGAASQVCPCLACVPLAKKLTFWRTGGHALFRAHDAASVW